MSKHIESVILPGDGLRRRAFLISSGVVYSRQYSPLVSHTVRTVGTLSLHHASSFFLALLLLVPPPLLLILVSVARSILLCWLLPARIGALAP